MLNQANILGHVAGVYNNDKFTKLIIMTNEKYKDSSGQLQERSDAHKITVFGKTKDYVDNYLKKGDLVMVTGKLTSGKYTDKNGNEVETYNIMGQSVRTVKRKDGEANTPSNFPSQNKTPQQKPQVNDVLDDDLPF